MEDASGRVILLRPSFRGAATAV
jgi:hypothetical protein